MHKKVAFAKPIILSPRYQLARILTGITGLNYLLAAILLLFVPHWFFNNIAPFAPFNRHFIGDVGSFILPIAVGLIFVALKPHKYWAVFILGLWASVIHTTNHLYDDVFVYNASLNHMLQDALPNTLLSAFLISAYIFFRYEAINTKGKQ